MHDIGKIGMPSYILQKQEPLTDEEWRLIHQHPAKGYEIVGRTRGLDGLSTIVRHHHERFQGGGYPDGLSGDAIPLESRIISVADTYDALTSERPYRRAMGAEEAREELRRVSGSQLDPRCVAAFLTAVEVTDLTPPPVPTEPRLPEAPRDDRRRAPEPEAEPDGVRAEHA
jgi:HD-GYP domain-containing protein (c-di-GMP phosphodiesterase class II)